MRVRARQVAVVGVVLAGLLVGTQLAFSDVGREVGRHWSQPAELASVQSDERNGVTGLSAAGDADSGAVAWIERDGDRWSVTVARITVDADGVSAGPARTVAESTSRLLDVAVAVDGDRTAVVWERKATNEVVAHLSPGGDTRVVSADPLRVEEPSVGFADGVAVVAWQEYADGLFDVRLAAVTDDRVRYATGGRPTAGENSPSVSTAGDRFAVSWIDSTTRTASVTTGRVSNGTVRTTSVRSYGRADPVGGFVGGRISIGGARNGTAVRTIWTDEGTVTLGTVTEDADGTATRALGAGKRPRVAVGGDRWLAAWLVRSRASGSDVTFRYGDTGRERDGVVSELRTNANRPRPFFGPSPAVAWTERGTRSRVLASGLRPTAASDPVARLRYAPARFVFVSALAAIAGAALFAFVPWSVAALLLAFAATSRLVTARALGGGARVADRAGRSTDRRRVTRRLESASPLVWTGLFAVGETAILVGVLPTAARVTSLGFSDPIGVSLLALAATVAVAAPGVVRLRSGWQGALLFAYFQTAALWTTALPTVL